MIHPTARRLGTGKLVPMFGTLLLTAASLSTGAPASAAQFNLSGTWNCIFECTQSSGTIQGSLTFDDVTGAPTVWDITTPSKTYQSGSGGQSGEFQWGSWSFSSFDTTTNTFSWLNLFPTPGSVDPNAPFNAGPVEGNEAVENPSAWGGDGDKVVTFWEGEVKSSSSAAVPEPSIVGGTLLSLLGGAVLKRKRAKQA